MFPQWGKLLGGMGSAKKDGKHEVKSGDEDNPLLDNASMNQKGFTQERNTACRHIDTTVNWIAAYLLNCQYIAVASLTTSSLELYYNLLLFWSL